jgi:hypothetical protein
MAGTGALAAVGGVGTGRSARTACANAPQPAYRHLEEVERPQAMASPSYGIDAPTECRLLSLARTMALRAKVVRPRPQAEDVPTSCCLWVSSRMRTYSL